MNYRLRELDQLHAASLKILVETGIKFMHEDALNVFRDNGFKVEGDIVYITAEQVNAALATGLPS